MNCVESLKAVSEALRARAVSCCARRTHREPRFFGNYDNDAQYWASDNSGPGCSIRKGYRFSLDDRPARSPLEGAGPAPRSSADHKSECALHKSSPQMVEAGNGAWDENKTDISLKVAASGLPAVAIALWTQWLSGDPAHPTFPLCPVLFLGIAAIVFLHTPKFAPAPSIGRRPRASRAIFGTRAHHGHSR
jgi:hypothetical protein